MRRWPALAGLVDHFMNAKLKRCDYKNLDCVMTWADGCTEAAGPRMPHSGLGLYSARDQRPPPSRRDRISGDADADLCPLRSQNVSRRPTCPVRVDATPVINPKMGDVTVVLGLLYCRQLNTLNDSKRT